MRRWAGWLIGIIMLAVGILPLRAQGAGEIIFLRKNTDISPYIYYGDLWSWTPGAGEPFQETTWGFNGRPVLSPDGTKLAYTSVTVEAVEGDAANTYFMDYDRDDPTNIWLLDIATRQFTRIAAQTETDPHRQIWRTTPVWSPDSKQLAWVAYGSAEQDYAAYVVVHDLTSGEESIWATGLGFGFLDGGIIHLPGLHGWGSTLARTIFTHGLPDPAFDPGYLLQIIDARGVFRQEIVSSVNYEDLNLRRLIWVQHEGAWFIALGYPAAWKLLNPETGERLALERAPALQTPDGAGVKLRPMEGGWQIVRPDGSAVILPYTGNEITLSPDGQAVAFVEEGIAYVWRDGQEVTRLLPDSAQDWQIVSLVWSPTVWVTDSAATLLPASTPAPVIENRG